MNTNEQWAYDGLRKVWGGRWPKAGGPELTGRECLMAIMVNRAHSPRKRPFTIEAVALAMYLRSGGGHDSEVQAVTGAGVGKRNVYLRLGDAKVTKQATTGKYYVAATTVQGRHTCTLTPKGQAAVDSLISKGLEAPAKPVKAKAKASKPRKAKLPPQVEPTPSPVEGEAAQPELVA